MSIIHEAFALALNHWWQISFTIIACSVSIVAAEYLGLTRSWWFPVGLGGVMSLMILEAYPYGWLAGDYIHIPLWVILSCMSYLLPAFFSRQGTNQRPKTIWEYFEEVDSIHNAQGGEPHQKGASAWVEYS